MTGSAMEAPARFACNRCTSRARLRMEGHSVSDCPWPTLFSQVERRLRHCIVADVINHARSQHHDAQSYDLIGLPHSGTGTGNNPESSSPELRQPSGVSRTTSNAKNVIAAIRIFMLSFANISVLMGHHPVVLASRTVQASTSDIVLLCER